MSYNDDYTGWSADGCRQHAAYLEKLDGCDASYSASRLYAAAAAKESAARQNINYYGTDGAKTASMLLGAGREQEVKDMVLDKVKKNLEDLLGK